MYIKYPRNKVKNFCFMFLVYFFSTFAMAQDISDVFHEKVSDSIESTANFLDDFFVSEHSEAEGSKTQVLFSYIGTVDDALAGRSQYFLNARLHLPKTENKFRILIQNAVDFESEVDADAANIEGADRPFEPVTEYTAALQYVFAETRLWRVSSRAGMSFSVPVDPFYRFRVRRLIPGTLLDTRLVQELYWSDSERFIEKSTIHLEKLLAPKYFARLRYEFQWGSLNEQFTLVNGFAIYQKIKQRRAVRYDVGYQAGLNNRFDLQRVFINVRYRRNILKSWMFYEAIPEFFRDETDWQQTRFQFIFKLDFVFGKARH